jgi:hypothetical protein
MQPIMPSTADLPSPRLSNRAALGIVGGLILVATLVLGVFGGGDSSDTGVASMSTAEIQAADEAAQAQARTAQAAIETYATDNAGQYAGATPDALQQIESTLTAPLAVDAQAGAYTVTVGSETDTTFSISRDSSGLTTFNCAPAGSGSCPDTGDWAQ